MPGQVTRLDWPDWLDGFQTWREPLSLSVVPWAEQRVQELTLSMLLMMVPLTAEDAGQFGFDRPMPDIIELILEDMGGSNIMKTTSDSDGPDKKRRRVVISLRASLVYYVTALLRIVLEPASGHWPSMNLVDCLVPWFVD